VPKDAMSPKWEARLIRCHRPQSQHEATIKGTQIATSNLPDFLDLRCEKDMLTLGRLNQADVCMDFGVTSVVSRRHASIRWRDGEFIIQDNNSMNGTFVNWLKVQSSVIRDGDSIVFGGGSNINIGTALDNAQRKNVQCLEWMFKVISAPKPQPSTWKDTECGNMGSTLKVPNVATSPPRQTQDEEWMICDSQSSSEHDHDSHQAEAKLKIEDDADATTPELEKSTGVAADKSDDEEVPMRQTRSMARRSSVGMLAQSPPSGATPLGGMPSDEQSDCRSSSTAAGSSPVQQSRRKGPGRKSPQSEQRPRSSVALPQDEAPKTRSRVCHHPQAEPSPKRRRGPQPSPTPVDAPVPAKRLPETKIDDTRPEDQLSDTSLPPQIPQSPVKEMFDFLPFVGIPRQKLASVRVGRMRLTPISPMEFTETQWKLTTDNPNMGAAGSFRLIINVRDIVWYKDHVAKKPFYFVIAVRNPISGVQSKTLDPASEDLGHRTLVFEVAKRDEGKALSKAILKNYTQYLNMSNIGIVPEKDVDTYFHGK